jgi:hypothetical protein
MTSVCLVSIVALVATLFSEVVIGELSAGKYIHVPLSRALNRESNASASAMSPLSQFPGLNDGGYTAQSTYLNNMRPRPLAEALQVSIGYPKQTVTLVVDTNSPDVWVNGNCSIINAEQAGASAVCVGAGTYDAAKSLTPAWRFNTVKELSFGSSGIGGNVTVQYYADDIYVGGVFNFVVHLLSG